MAAFLDNCKFTPTAGGTTDWTYSAAVTGYQSPTAAGVVNGTKYKYMAISTDLTQWEIGEGAYNTTTGVLPRTTVLFNSSGTTSKINFSAAPQVAIVAVKEDLISVEEANSFTTTQKKQAQSNIFVGPTTQSLTSGTVATYTTPAGALWLEVYIVGGGGGGAGATTSGSPGSETAGSAGGASQFNSVVANGGSGAPGTTAAVNTPLNGGAGGTGGTGTAQRRQAGESGTGGGTYNAPLPASVGGASALGAGAPSAGSAFNTAGISAAANSGGGGSGAFGGSAQYNVGGGGGGGELAYLIINNPAVTYSYTVGAGGAGGVNTINGGNGGSGFIFVIEHYGS